MTELEQKYLDVVNKISQLRATTDLDKWILAMSAQMQDLVKRAASPKCAERRMNKLLYHWQEYVNQKQ